MLQELLVEMEQLKKMHAEPNQYEQLEFALTQLTQFYNENCFEFPDKRLNLAEAKYQFLLETISDYVRVHSTTTKM